MGEQDFQEFALVERGQANPVALPFEIDCADDDGDGRYLARFSVTSEDLTYGFGVFRADHSMVFQMQVLPGHVNDVLWQFTEDGTFTIRSTEYSGPAAYSGGVFRLVREDAIRVTGCAAEQ